MILIVYACGGIQCVWRVIVHSIISRISGKKARKRQHTPAEPETAVAGEHVLRMATSAGADLRYAGYLCAFPHSTSLDWGSCEM